MPLHIKGRSLLISTSPCASLSDVGFYELQDPLLNHYTEPISQAITPISIILGQPFLATSNALINSRNGVMKRTFGNMTIELNIYNICKQPTDDDDDEEIDEVNMIQTLVEGKFAHSMFSDPIEACLLNSNNDDIELDMINALLDATPAMDNNRWKSCF